MLGVLGGLLKGATRSATNPEIARNPDLQLILIWNRVGVKVKIIPPTP